MHGKLTVGAVLLLLVIIFTLQNAEVVSVRFLFWSFSTSRIILLFLVFASGAVAGWGLNSLSRALREE